MTTGMILIIVGVLITTIGASLIRRIPGSKMLYTGILVAILLIFVIAGVVITIKH